MNRVIRLRKIITEPQSSRAGENPHPGGAGRFPRSLRRRPRTGDYPWERERATSLKTALARLKADGREAARLSILIGPEGGFTEEEVGYRLRQGHCIS